MVSFTVAIPTHDRRETVVLAALSAARQTRPPAEVLVLCDGCTDGTEAAIEALGEPLIRAVTLPKAPGYAYGHRNLAVVEGTGDVVMWQGDDDLLLPDHLEQLGAVWDAGDVDLVVAPAALVHEDDRLEWVGRDWSVPQHRKVMAEQGNTSVMASVSALRAAVEAAGGWDAAVERAGDWELWCRLLARGARPAMVPEATVLHFRATGRRQPWPDRVRQNTAWFERLGDAAALGELRRRTQHARSEFEGELSLRIDEATAVAAAAHAHARAQDEAAAAAHAYAETQARTLTETARAAEEQHHAREAAEARLAAVYDDFVRVSGELEQVTRALQRREAGQG